MSILTTLFKDQLKVFRKRLWLSSLGARVCYNKGSIEDLLFKDHRIINTEGRAEFLKKLAFKYYHTSVFAHTFNYFALTRPLGYSQLLSLGYPEDIARDIYSIHTENEEISKVIGISLLGGAYFKSVPIPKDKVIGLSFRCFVEDADEEEMEVLNDLIENSTDPDYNKSIGLDEFLEGKLKTVLLYYDLCHTGYAVFLIKDISRATTHQLVRHTKLNYSQRSQRYVREGKEDSYITPKVKPPAEKTFKAFYKYANVVYNLLVEQHKVKKEDARFILPNATKTVIMVSGTLKDIDDFIQKRIIHQAQWEIREIAEEMRYLLSRINKKEVN